MVSMVDASLSTASSGSTTTSMTSSSSVAPSPALSQASSSSAPPKTVVHGSLVAVQCIFGAGGVVAALGLPSCNPFAFALYREIAAGAILLVAATLFTAATRSKRETSTGGRGPLDEELVDTTEPLLLTSNVTEMSSPQSKSSKQISLFRPRFWQTAAWLPWHFPSGQEGVLRLLVLGLMIFGNQVSVIVGIKLAGPVSCAVWQPSQPVLTAAICMLLGREPFRLQRVLGVLLAFAGCAAMVVLSTQEAAVTESTSSVTELIESSLSQTARRMAAVPISAASSTSTTDDTGFKSLLGNLFFFINCLCTSLYVILSKPAMRIYPALFVSAWSYNIAAAIMAVAAILASQSVPFMTLVCPDCLSYWSIPPGAYFPLAYYILFNSVLAYAVLTWANQFATGTLVMGYSVLQPVTAATLTVVLLNLQIFPSCVSLAQQQQQDESSTSSFPKKACLEQPGMGTLIGMFGVFVGLSLVVATEPSSNSSSSNNNNGSGGSSSNSSRLKKQPEKEEGVLMTPLPRRLLKRPSSKVSGQQHDTEGLAEI